MYGFHPERPHRKTGGHGAEQDYCENQAATDLRDIVLDLKDVGAVNRDVVRFFVSCEADGVKLENCTPYIREWMEREKD